MTTSLIYASNSQPQDVAIGGTVNFGTPVRRYGKNLTMSGGNVVATGEELESFGSGGGL